MKPGYQTTEFWQSLITTLAGLLAASGALNTSGNNATQQVAGMAVAFLSSGAYLIMRTWLKNQFNLMLPAPADPSASPTGTTPASSAT